MAGELVVVRGRVVDVRRQQIPRMYVVTVKGDDGSTVEFDAHEELVVYKPEERLEVAVYSNIPDYREGEDYVVNATVASVRHSDNVYEYLLSAGGLLFMLRLPYEVDLRPTQRVVVRVSRIK